MKRNWKPYYSAARPRKVVGGLKLHARRGAPAGTWWGKRWSEALESFGWHTRLERGRRYARQGQVCDIKIEPGVVSASVQGSRAKPYQVRISLQAFTHKDWRRAAEVLAGKAVFAAKLLAGEMPLEIESAFSRLGMPLFPKSKRDLSTDCSCPDFENPCKHIAAVYYVLAQEFDRDAFLIFKLRGMGREELLSEIRLRRKTGARASDPDGWVPDSPASAESTEACPPPASPAEGFTGNLENFYQCPQTLPEGLGLAATQSGRLPKPGSRLAELGTPPFWRGEADFSRAMTAVCAALRRRVPALVAGVNPGPMIAHEQEE